MKLTRYSLISHREHFPNNEGIYCREWDVLNPEVGRIVFELMDEIIEAFRADAMHIGMDEVFLLGSEKWPSTMLFNVCCERYEMFVDEGRGFFVVV